MPKVKVQGINLYYEVHGAGYPLVLIRGFGSNADHWYCQTPGFSSRYNVVTFDNRGIGRSDKPDVPCTISIMADDTVGLMDAIGISKAHILGISMGGMIAQEIALRYPQRVHGLILACTHCGGDRAVRPSEEIARIFVEYIFTGSQEAAQNTPKCLFTERTLREAPEVVERYQEVSRRFPPTSEAMIRQWEAIQGHDTWEDLSHVQAPTLVLSGTDDVLVPPENSRILAERIPNAQLRLIEGGGHQFLVEKADAFNRVVLEFLEALPKSS
jgi:pimeloyl-ACP methyl ester carboxylesterase